MGYEERRRLEVEAWERADPPRSRTLADVFERICDTVERIGTGIRYVFRAVAGVVLGVCSCSSAYSLSCPIS